jgi:hypothetical protein
VRILKRVAEKVRDDSDGGGVMDINGNRVGK